MSFDVTIEPSSINALTLPPKPLTASGPDLLPKRFLVRVAVGPGGGPRGVHSAGTGRTWATTIPDLDQIGTMVQILHQRRDHVYQ